MPDETVFTEGAMISLRSLADLHARVKTVFQDSGGPWAATMACLHWADEQGFLTPPSDRLQMKVEGQSVADLVRAAMETAIAISPVLETHDIPTGPQASSGKPDTKAAGDLNAVADRPECEVKAPMGAEGVVLSPDEAPAPPFDPSRPGWWRTANANLSALGYRRPFTARGDLQLVEHLLKGMKIDVVAADMLISAVELKNRWRALLSAVGTPEGEKPNIEEQAHLLEILRARAAEKSLKAAE